MLETIVKTAYGIIFGITNFYIMNKLLDTKEKLISRKNIILVVLLAIIYIIFYTIEYFIPKILLKFMIGFFISALIFDVPIHKIILANITYILIVLTADLLNTCIYMQFIPIENLRGNWFYITLSNTTVLITIYLLMKINPLIYKMQHFIKKSTIFNNQEIQLFFVLVLITIIHLFYNMTMIYKMNYNYIINFIIIICFLIILFIYIKNNLHYSDLQKEYDALFIYVQEFEDTIDSMSVDNHEYKNQLAMLKGYVEDQETVKALTIIDEMTKEQYKKDSKILRELKHIPKCGLKGLLYYKIIVSNNNNLKLGIDISKNILNDLEKLKLSQIKIICQLIGIYFDNAIEASKESKQKLIALEVYKLQDNIEFVFSNTFAKEKVKISKIGEKGYTTKGKGHGKGTYLANKVIAKNEFLDTKTDIINEMYVKKLIIKLNKKI